MDRVTNADQGSSLAAYSLAMMFLLTLTTAMMCLILVFLMTAVLPFGRMIQRLAPLAGLRQGDEVLFLRTGQLLGLQAAAATLEYGHLAGEQFAKHLLADIAHYYPGYPLLL